MADYISSLSGQEMDVALTDMAQHTSEAWAVGTRNGIDVTSGDETYENNSKYYAEQASTYISGTVTAAVRWDTAQSLDSAGKAQARSNIAAAPTASPTFTGTVTVPTPTAGDSSTKAASTAFVGGEIQTALNRTTAVNVANTSYTTLMARGSSLNSTETTPAVNGAIAWLYE